MEDAILGAVGTLLLVGVAFVIVLIGLNLLVSVATPSGIVIGGLAVLFGGYLTAATLEIIPPDRTWF